MNTLSHGLVTQIANQLDAQGEANPLQNLRLIAEQFAGKAVFLTNFTLEDQLITHWIATHNLPIKVVVSNPNYPFKETYTTWAKTQERYQVPITVYATDGSVLENQPQHPASTTSSFEENLQPILQGEMLLITGTRAGQSWQGRQLTADFSWNKSLKIFEFHPLFHRSFHKVFMEVLREGVPFNPLHNQGYLRVGHAQDIETAHSSEFWDGRWWWEHAQRIFIHPHTPGVRKHAV
ncbi:phosphoadenosine phosphosulfate reductase family protein [Haliscomenobacter hydrossis]|uniref:Phosphoadenosine phosphosulfate reductase n=1 Tax=Haliscomenobacter hydrossis (strain ATCC 27775 / DSM 1100 / LMG 10767 / O) TaxID=760192 RepID=F4L3Y5_HALH1|nr:phosphoadenosine phosphosulfate reductase family protein [Haliscomenobacter hydrossis]AEE49702.1 phosphoadenosine phosphosulfate reductase [Haliscomenobacter hydrossis DSM 1100]